MDRISRTVLAAIAALLIAAGPLWADTIKRNPANMDNVTVVKETYKKVAYKLPDTDIQNEFDRKKDKILGVDYDEWPEGYEDGKEALGESNFQKAVDCFDLASKASSTDFPQAKQYGLFMKAEALRCWGESGNGGAVDAAIKAYDALLAAEPETVHAAKAYIGRGKCLLLKGSKDEALGYFDKVPADEYFSERDKIDAKIGKAQVLELDKQWPKALSEYQSILAEAQKTAPECAYMVRVRSGACFIGLGKTSEALDEFNKILASSDVPAEIRNNVRAAALNGRGECGWKNKEYDKALWDFLRVVVLYESVTTESPKAYYYASQCMKNIARILDKENKKEDARNWKGRASELEKELKEKFPGSAWTRGG